MNWSSSSPGQKGYAEKSGERKSGARRRVNSKGSGAWVMGKDSLWGGSWSNSTGFGSSAGSSSIGVRRGRRETIAYSATFSRLGSQTLHWVGREGKANRGPPENGPLPQGMRHGRTAAYTVSQTTRNPTSLQENSARLELRVVARRLWKRDFQLPPRYTRRLPLGGPFGCRRSPPL